MQVLLELTEQAVSLGHEKAGLMERLQARSWEIDQILRERDGHIEAIRKAEQSEQALRQVGVFSTEPQLNAIREFARFLQKKEHSRTPCKGVRISECCIRKCRCL